MSHTIRLYQFNKETNSLDTPDSNTTYFDIDVVFKNPCSILAPSFVYQKEDNKPDILSTAYAYAKISDFGDRYYFISNKISLGNDRVQVNLDLDIGGTYASTIRGYTGLIARSTSNYNPLLQDELFIPLQDIYIPEALSDVVEKNYTLFKSTGQSGDNTKVSFTWTVNGKGGTTIFNTLNTPDVTLAELLDSASFWTDFEFGITDMTKYITSCVAVVGALDVGASLTYQTHYISVGNTSGNERPQVTQCAIINVTDMNECIWGATDMDIKTDMDILYGANDFRRYTEPYTSIQAWIPFVGNVNIDPLTLRGDRLHCQFAISPVNGDGRIILTNEYGNSATPKMGEIIGAWSINASLPIPMSVVTDLYRSLNNNVGAISTALDKGVGAWNNIGNSLGGDMNIAGASAKAVSSMLDDVSQAVDVFRNNSGVVDTLVDIYSTITAGFRHDSTIGSTGALVDFIANFKDISIKLIQRTSTPDNFKTEVGRKSLIYSSINTLQATGFIQFVKPSVKLPNKALSSERIAVNKFMSDGFYI